MVSRPRFRKRRRRPPARCRRHSARARCGAARRGARRGAAPLPLSRRGSLARGPDRAEGEGKDARGGRGHAARRAPQMDRHEGARPRGELELLRCGVVFFTPFFFCFVGAGARAEEGGRRERAHPRSMPCAPRRVRGRSWRPIGPRAGGARPLAGPRGGVRGAARAATVRARWVPFFFRVRCAQEKKWLRRRCGAGGAAPPLGRTRCAVRSRPGRGDRWLRSSASARDPRSAQRPRSLPPTTTTTACEHAGADAPAPAAERTRMPARRAPAHPCACCPLARARQLARALGVCARIVRAGPLPPLRTRARR